MTTVESPPVQGSPQGTRSDGRLRHPHCEVAIVEHCNLSCRACSHLSPVMPRREMSSDDVARDLGLLWEHYESRWVVLLGGEPLLHSNLAEVIDAVHAVTAPARVAVVTNGTLLARMPDAFWRAVDGVQVCLYPGKELERRVIRACRHKAKANGVAFRATWIDRFRESYSEVGTDDDELVGRIYAGCALKQGHTIANGTFYKCPPAYFLPKVVEPRNPGVSDGVPLAGPGLGARLREYLSTDEPLESCRNCLGSAGRSVPQSQTARSAFRSLQARPTAELLDVERLRPPAWTEQRLRKLRPRYYRHERRLI
jgi:cyclic pyranopterin phosphate synthase